jgi:ABC-type molybdate transport system substrate-binding protein
MNAKLAIVVVFLAAAGGILYVTTSKKDSGAPPLPTLAPTAAGAPANDAIEITTVYSTEKQAWIEAAAADFQKANPSIKVTLVGKGSLDAAQGILDGKLKPTVFSPADSMVMNLLSSDWQIKNHADLFAASGDDAPQPLVITPLVLIIWEDRAAVLLKASGGHVGWKAVHKAVTSNQGWPAVGGKADWGFVKLGHTDPTRSNSGLQALLLMTLEFYGKKTNLQIADVLNPDYQAFIRDLEKGVSRFEASTGTFMTDMVRFGPSKYDIAVVYESLAIAQLENAQGRWGNLKVYYPSTTLWNDHPAAIVQADWVTEPQKKAARAWLQYLRSRPAQERALAYGFRPADPAVPLKSADAQNPFTRLAQYGIQLELPPVAKTPDGAFVRALMTMWSRVAAPR